MLTYEIRNDTTKVLTIPIADGDVRSSVTVDPGDKYWILEDNWNSLTNSYRAQFTITGTRGSSGGSGGSYDGTSTYDKVTEEESSLISYFGEAVAGSSLSSPVWRIYRWSIEDNVSQKRFADGSTEFDKVWSNRASYDYTP